MISLGRFANETSGNVAVITAFSLIGVAGAAAIAFMTAQRNDTETRLQAKLDAAVLAGTSLGRDASNERRVAAAESVFKANLKPVSDDPGDAAVLIANAETEFLVSHTKVTGTARTKIRNPLGSYVGQEELDIEVTATAEQQLSDPLCVLTLNDRDARSLEIYGEATFEAKKLRRAEELRVGRRHEAIRQQVQWACRAIRRDRRFWRHQLVTAANG